jgi:hypothetical protein
MSNSFPSPPPPGSFGASGANPFGDTINPYASPQEAGVLMAEIVGPASPFAGLWRQGNLLVMHKQAPLPDICLKSNLPSERRLKRSLTWHHPALYLLVLLHVFIYIIVAMIVRNTATIHIPLTQEWYSRRHRRMAFSWGAIVLCILLAAVGIAYVDQSPLAPWAIIASIPAALAFAIYGLRSCQLVSAKRMNGDYIWLKGVHPEFLDRLEPWVYSL